MSHLGGAMAALDLQYELIDGPPGCGAAGAAADVDMAIFIGRLFESDFVCGMFLVDLVL